MDMILDTKGAAITRNTLDKDGNIRRRCENCHEAFRITMSGTRWKYTCPRGTFSASHPACEDFIPHGYVRVVYDDGSVEVVPWQKAIEYYISAPQL